MNRIVPENPGFASPHSTLARMLEDRAVRAAAVFDEQIRMASTSAAGVEVDDYDIPETTTPAERERRDAENWQRGLDIQAGFKIIRARAARARHPSRARRMRRPQARVRARRSPVSVRRATTDSGGTDGDGGGDPEPPHRPSNTPRVGGAL